MQERVNRHFLVAISCSLIITFRVEKSHYGNGAGVGVGDLLPLPISLLFAFFCLLALPPYTHLVGKRERCDLRLMCQQRTLVR